jgi:pilus assembly protein Flp/PilA
MGSLINRLIQEESGQAMAEYGLVLAFIAIVALVAVKAVGTSANTQLNNVASQLSS